MPCGPQLIEAVARCLFHDDVATPTQIQVSIETSLGKVSTRSIRSAIAELIKQGRAKRKGQQGPVYAVRAE